MLAHIYTNCVVKKINGGDIQLCKMLLNKMCTTCHEVNALAVN